MSLFYIFKENLDVVSDCAQLIDPKTLFGRNELLYVYGEAMAKVISMDSQFLSNYLN